MKTRSWKNTLLVVCLALLSEVHPTAAAPNTTGADALLNSVSKKNPTDAQNPAGGAEAESLQAMQSMSGMKLDNPFAMHLFSTWQVSKRMPYHVDMWVKKILEQDYRGAAHLWSRVEGDFNEEFSLTGEVAYVYLLWKLRLSQTFFDRWLSMLAVDSKRNSKAMNALHLTIEPTFAAWLVDAAILPTPEQTQWISRALSAAAPAPITDSLLALVGLRAKLSNLENTKQLLSRLGARHPLKIRLAETLALAYARAGDLGQAGQVLKLHLEPAVLATRKPELLSKYYLEIARLLYQADALDAAEQFYMKVPSGRPEFITAREELTWILLRKNDTEKLRGELKNFKLGLFDEQFLPEVYVVSAIGNLKLCFYNQVHEDFAAFIRAQKHWAERIQKETKAEIPARPLLDDFFVTLAERANAERGRELAELGALGKESIGAVLPSVGVQHHWQEAEQKQSLALENVKKIQISEYRRVWKNMAAMLREAIRKMQFVKVELLSQVSQLAQNVDSAKGAPNRKPLPKIAAQDGDDTLSFPYDGTFWNDELFHLRVVTEGVCL